MDSWTAKHQTQTRDRAANAHKGWTSAELAEVERARTEIAASVAARLGRSLYAIYNVRRAIRAGAARVSSDRPAREAPLPAAVRIVGRKWATGWTGLPGDEMPW